MNTFCIACIFCILARILHIIKLYLFHMPPKVAQGEEVFFAQRKSVCCPENGERDAWVRPLVSHHRRYQWHTIEGCQLCNPSCMLFSKSASPINLKFSCHFRRNESVSVDYRNKYSPNMFAKVFQFSSNHHKVRSNHTKVSWDVFVW